MAETSTTQETISLSAKDSTNDNELSKVSVSQTNKESSKQKTRHIIVVSDKLWALYKQAQPLPRGWFQFILRRALHSKINRARKVKL